MIPLTILMTTYAPAGLLGEATRDAVYYSIRQWNRRLRYGGELALHVADDGSDLSGYGVSAESPPGCWWTRGPVTFSRQERHGVGASLNAGLRAAFKRSPVAALLMDDWGMKWPFPMDDWVHLLEREDIGQVRLGPPYPGIRGQVEGFPQGWFLRLERNCVFAGLRPFMVHERFMNAYGPYPEDVPVGDCERVFNERVAEAPGPDVAYALPSPWEWVYYTGGGYPRPSLAGVEPREPNSFATYECGKGHRFDWPTHNGPLEACQWIVDPSQLDFFASICGAPVEAR